MNIKNITPPMPQYLKIDTCRTEINNFQTAEDSLFFFFLSRSLNVHIYYA